MEWTSQAVFKTWHLAINLISPWMEWACLQVFKAWHLAINLISPWMEWACQAVCKTWHLGITLITPWMEWTCQAVFKAWHAVWFSTIPWLEWVCQAVFGAWNWACSWLASRDFPHCVRCNVAESCWWSWQSWDGINPESTNWFSLYVYGIFMRGPFWLESSSSQRLLKVARCRWHARCFHGYFAAKCFFSPKGSVCLMPFFLWVPSLVPHVMSHLFPCSTLRYFKYQHCFCCWDLRCGRQGCKDTFRGFHLCCSTAWSFRSASQIWHDSLTIPTCIR